jgi:hypothetical protein
MRRMRMEKKIKSRAFFAYMHDHWRGMAQVTQLNKFEVLNFDFASLWTSMTSWDKFKDHCAFNTIDIVTYSLRLKLLVALTFLDTFLLLWTYI